MRGKRKQDLEKQEFWRKHLGQLQASGMSQAGYCREHGLKWFQLHYWRKKLEGAEEETVGAVGGGRLRLVPIQVISERGAPKQGGIQLSFDEFTIEVNEGFPSETLQKLIKTLRLCRC